jgi:amidase
MNGASSPATPHQSLQDQSHCIQCDWSSFILLRASPVLQVSAKPPVYEFDRRLPPRAVVRDGEKVRVESDDALSGQIRRSGDRRNKAAVPQSNPVAGPIAVAGAKPGDAIAVTIHEIAPRDGTCCTYVASSRRLAEWLGSDVPYRSTVCRIADGLIHFDATRTIPYTPMLGCVGTAPSWGTPTTGTAGPHGGNLDLVEVAPGNTILLPVFVPEGMLFVGDAHAAQGHGELSGTGLEMAAQSVLTIDLRPAANLPGVRIEGPDFIMAVATAGSLERAVAEAYARLVLWMEADHGWDRWEAYDLLTHVGTLSIGEYSSGTVGAKIDRRHL